MEDKELISEGTFADLYALTEHERIPTELELDRFIRGHGYRRIKREPPVLSDEKIGYAVLDIAVKDEWCFRGDTLEGNLPSYRAIAQAQLDADVAFYGGIDA